jgi:outer membrane protein TolC
MSARRPGRGAGTLKILAVAAGTGVLLCAALAVRAQQPSGANSFQNPFLGSVPSGRPSPGTLPLTLPEAIRSGLRTNLGLLLSREATQVARSNRVRALSRLLPLVEGGLSGAEQELNLKTMVGPKTLPPTIPSIAGPFDVFDARASVSVTVLNLSALEGERSAARTLASAGFSYQQARDTVVLAVGNAYLVAVASKAQARAAAAELRTAQALYQLAVDRERAGLSPEIDTLRALVELKTRQENLLAAENSHATDKLTLARAAGLPTGQAFALTSRFPYQPLRGQTLAGALANAYRHRGDYQAAAAALAAAAAQQRAAKAERLPSLTLNANWGEMGTDAADTHQTYAVAGTVRIPVFQGGRVRGDILAADARLRQAQDQLANLKGQIDYDVRTALLNLNTEASQVGVAQAGTTLAAQTLAQARDRFAAGVADNIEVVQAQQALAQAEDTYIASLYGYNLSKLALARAMGVAERDGLSFLGDQHP